MLTAKTIVYNPVLVDSDSAIGSLHQIPMAVLAKSFLHGRRKLNLVLHGNLSCNLYIFVRKPAVLLEMLLCKLKEKIYALFRNLQLLHRFLIISFFGHIFVDLHLVYFNVSYSMILAKFNGKVFKEVSL